MNRRQHLRQIGLGSIALWSSPIITAISLPAHAQTSCSGVDIAGDWQFIQGGDGFLFLTLNEDGTGFFNSRSLSWSISGFGFVVRIPSAFPDAQSDRVYTLTLNGTCDRATGTANNGDSVEGDKVS